MDIMEFVRIQSIINTMTVGLGKTKINVRSCSSTRHSTQDFRASAVDSYAFINNKKAARRDHLSLEQPNYLLSIHPTITPPFKVAMTLLDVYPIIVQASSCTTND
jgi:hypothetical protein